MRVNIRSLVIVVGLVLLFSLSSAGHVTAAPPINWDVLDPVLMAAVQANPDATFPIILEMTPDAKESPGKSGAARAKHALNLISAKAGQAKNSLALIGAGTGLVGWNTLAQLSRDPSVRFIALDRPLQSLSDPAQTTWNAGSPYADIVHAPDVWALGYTGKGIGVAILDSGVAPNADVQPVACVDLLSNNSNCGDPGGHGTHVAGIIAGSGVGAGNSASGIYKGVAPGANIVSVRVLNEKGSTNLSTVIKGLEWAAQNRNTYNIRVVNLSFGAKAMISYEHDPLVTAVELLWHMGIVVISAAGNSGPAAMTIQTPAIDPYSIAVGALDDNRTVGTYDDSVPSFSSHGPTIDYYSKPDLVAPGRKLISGRAAGSYLELLLPAHLVTTSNGNKYFRLTGTSQAAPVVSGIVALMLEENPGLKPNQVKYILKQTAHPLPYTSSSVQGAGRVDALAAVTSNLTGSANWGLRPSDGFAAVILPLIQGTQPLTWREPYYGGRTWSRYTWGNLTWDNLTWDNLTWDNLTWDNLTWDNLTWDNLTWDNLTWDNLTWDATSIDAQVPDDLD